MNELVNDEAVCRTAPATPGLLNIPDICQDMPELCPRYAWVMLGIIHCPMSTMSLEILIFCNRKKYSRLMKYQGLHEFIPISLNRALG